MNIEIHQRVINKINECSEIVFQKTGQRIIPELSYKLRGTVAGRGGLINGKPTIILNPVLLAENVDKMINQTVPHEFAHVIQYTVFMNSYGNSGHGIIWQRVMGWLGVPAIRCHSYDVTNARVRKVTRHEFVCGCAVRVHKVTTIRLNRMMAGTKYCCTYCHQPIVAKQSVCA